MVFQKNKINIQAGLRIENTNYKINKINEDAFLYPLVSLSASDKFKKNNIIRLTYNRRLSYPNYKLLVPFTYFTPDSLSSRSGNSHLKPAMIDKFELAYSTEKKNCSFSISAVTKKHSNYIGMQYSVTNGVLSSQAHNFSKILSAGGEFSITATISFLELNFDGNLYYWDYSGTAHDGLSHSLSTEIMAYLPLDITVGMEFELFARNRYPNGYMDQYNPCEYFYVDKMLFSNKAKFSFYWMYPFLSDVSETILWNEYFNETQYSIGKDFIVGIGFSYFFNHGKDIAAKKVKSNMEHDEEKK
jgi:hypothetical protein